MGEGSEFCGTEIQITIPTCFADLLLEDTYRSEKGSAGILEYFVWHTDGDLYPISAFWRPAWIFAFQ